MFIPFEKISSKRDLREISTNDSEDLVATDLTEMSPIHPGKVWRDCVLYGVSPTYISGELYDDDDYDDVDPSSDPRSNFTDMIEDKVSTALDKMKVPVDSASVSPEPAPSVSVAPVE